MDVQLYDCPYCGASYLTPQARDGHTAVCEENPDAENPAQPGEWHPDGHGQFVTPASDTGEELRTDGGQPTRGLTDEIMEIVVLLADDDSGQPGADDDHVVSVVAKLTAYSTRDVEDAIQGLVNKGELYRPRDGRLKQTTPDDHGDASRVRADGGTKTVSSREFQARLYGESTTPRDQQHQCPSCGSTVVHSKSPNPTGQDRRHPEPYVCGQCGTHFDTPDRQGGEGS